MSDAQSEDEEYAIAGALHALVRALRERDQWGAVLAEATPAELVTIGQALAELETSAQWAHLDPVTPPAQITP